MATAWNCKIFYYLSVHPPFMHYSPNNPFRSYKKACEPYTHKAHTRGSKSGREGGDNHALLGGELLRLEQAIERVQSGNGNGDTLIQVYVTINYDVAAAF